jgi:serine/threonine-protein kinase
MRQACGSIAEAHAAGLIHRDIKPANVMLCERGGLLDFVKVLDFGLVRQQRQSESTALTDAHSITGTPLYMAPEAVRDADSLDARGDVYQLGQVAYYLLTGHHVFTAENPMDVMLKHVSEAPVPPSQVRGEPISESLEQLVLRCLEKDRDRRPASAGELLEAFESCSVKGTWSQADARAWWSAWRASGHPDLEKTPSSGSIPTGIDLASRTPVS